MKSVLIAHSSIQTAQAIETALIKIGVGTTIVNNGSTAFEIAEKEQTPFIITEIDLPEHNGFEILERVLSRKPDSRIVLTAANPSARLVTDVIRAGAYDFLPEPIEPSELDACLSRLVGESEAAKCEVPPAPAVGRYGKIIGDSAAIKRVFKLVDKVAKTDSTVMIYGESGTGKELISRAIHQNSNRCDKPLIPVNCGAIPEELLESELFGHEKGAFTSAIRTRIGRFEMADGGTIFLDEIADMSPKLQVKILRVLQEHQFERIGGAKTIDVDIRVITATNKDLRTAVEEGRFREDLFYRLNVIPINVPPLRERHNDIPLLVDHFISKFRQTKGIDIKGIEPDALAKICGYEWPGNIRELENIIERMVILAEEDMLTLDDLPPRISNIQAKTMSPHLIEITDEGIDFNQVVSDFENQLLLQALEKSDWVKNKAAQLLKLNRTTLVEKLKKKKLTPSDM